MLPVDERRLDEALIRERLASLTVRLKASAEAAGRDPDGFRIVAVTKGFGAEVVHLAVRAGLTRLGENRVVEALPKIAAEPGVEWHLIGHLQSNKAGRAVNAFGWIHSVHDLALLRRLERIAHDTGSAPRLLLQVNLTDEATKSGWGRMAFAREITPGSELTAALRDLRHARVVGLMTIARLGAPAEEARATFRTLRELRDALEQAAGSGLPELSMGMTADAAAGVAEGATIVRVGTALFGPRPA
jgi:pyridoxal phosphate enzyme (YggS family)